MRGSRNIFGLAVATTAVIGWALGAGIGEAKAQSAAPNGWVTYAPAPVQTAPTTVVAPAAPAATAVAPGWQGYAPARAWTPYQPQTSWRYYAPQQGWVAAPAPAAAPTATRSAAIGPRNREYGTGRNVHMHKPWLPSHP